MLGDLAALDRGALACAVRRRTTEIKACADYTIPDIGRFAIAERETLSSTSAERVAAVQTSEVEDPGDKVRDLGVDILRSRSNSFRCRR